MLILNNSCLDRFNNLTFFSIFRHLLQLRFILPRLENGRTNKGTSCITLGPGCSQIIFSVVSRTRHAGILDTITEILVVPACSGSIAKDV